MAAGIFSPKPTCCCITDPHGAIAGHGASILAVCGQNFGPMRTQAAHEAALEQGLAGTECRPRVFVRGKWRRHRSTLEALCRLQGGREHPHLGLQGELRVPYMTFMPGMCRWQDLRGLRQGHLWSARGVKRLQPAQAGCVGYSWYSVNLDLICSALGIASTDDAHLAAFLLSLKFACSTLLAARFRQFSTQKTILTCFYTLQLTILVLFSTCPGRPDFDRYAVFRFTRLKTCTRPFHVEGET